MTGTWRNAKTDVPRDGVKVVCVIEMANGQRVRDLGTHWMDRPYDDGWITHGGDNNVICWMTLPEIPEGEVRFRRTVQDAEGQLKDCVNELCLQCGQYKREHEGACGDCRWLEIRKGV